MNSSVDTHRSGKRYFKCGLTLNVPAPGPGLLALRVLVSLHSKSSPSPRSARCVPYPHNPTVLPALRSRVSRSGFNASPVPRRCSHPHHASSPASPAPHPPHLPLTCPSHPPHPLCNVIYRLGSPRLIQASSHLGPPEPPADDGTAGSVITFSGARRPPRAILG